MFDLRELNIKDFGITLEDGLKLTLNPPKMKVLRKLMASAKKLTAGDDQEVSDDELDTIMEVVAMMLNSNQEGKKISVEYVEENFDISQLISFVQHYMEWITTIYQSKN